MFLSLVLESFVTVRPCVIFLFENVILYFTVFGMSYVSVIVMIPLLINQSNISRKFSLRLSKRLEDSDLAVIGLTGIEPIRKISYWTGFLLYEKHHVIILYYILENKHIYLSYSTQRKTYMLAGDMCEM
jgi:hypothetical protein